MSGLLSPSERKQARHGLLNRRPQSTDVEAAAIRARGLLSSAADWAGKNPLDAAALATSPIPIVGDVVGGVADAKALYEDPSWTNAGLAAVGLLPFVPGGLVGAIKSVDDLPMDTASRMARANEMGFDFDAYHGTVTKHEFDQFGKPKPRGGTYETYFAPEQHKDFANGFATAEQGRIYPVKLKTSNYLDTRKPEHRKIFEEILEEKNLFGEFKYARKESGDPDLPGWGNQSVIDAVGEAGFDGMFIQERPHMESVAVFNPKTVRSRFAAFDPSKLGSANILAGVAAGTIALPMVAGMENEQ